MNVAYNQINCADASKILHIDYSTVVGWCRDNKINCVNVSDGTQRGRYYITEEEVDYLKSLKQKFGKPFMKRYRKDWKKGKEPAIVYADTDSTITVASIKSTISTEQPKDQVDIDELAIKIGYIQDIKQKIEKLDAEREKLTHELEKLREDVTKYL